MPKQIPGPSAAYRKQLSGARARRPQRPTKSYDADANNLGPIPPGGFSFGTQIVGGPLYVDIFASRPAPSPWELVERHLGLVFSMVAKKRDAVASVPLRLMCDGSRKILGGRPRAISDPIRVSRSVAIKHAKQGLVSSAAVANVYEIRNHPILEALDNPDGLGYFTRQSLIGLLVMYQDVVGQAFLIPEGNGWDWRLDDQSKKKGPPQYLHVLYPQYVIPFRAAGSPLITAWQYFEDYIPFEASIWFRQSLSLRDAYGSSYSPTYGGFMYADQEARFMAIFDQVLGLGPRPSLLVSPKDSENPMGEYERKRLAQDLTRQHAAGNAGNVLVTTSALDVTPMSYAPTDMAGLNLSEYDRTNLATIFGLPPTYFTTETNLANLEAADAMFARFAVGPMCRSIADVLTRMVRRFDQRLYFQFDSPIADDEMQQAQIDKMYVDMGAITINELNEDRKYTPKPWGDVPLVSGTLVPIDTLIEKARKSVEQMDAQMASQKNRDEFELQDESADGEEGGEGGAAGLDREESPDDLPNAPKVHEVAEGEDQAEYVDPQTLSPGKRDTERTALLQRRAWLMDEFRRRIGA